jgi:hypothetical protein
VIGQLGDALAVPDGSLHLLAAWLGSAALSVPLELLLKPGVPLRRRPAFAWFLQLGIWTLLYSVALLVSQRAFFAAGAALALHLLVVLVNNAKHRALQEPFLFSDFGLFSQALRHPRLYLPFLGLGPALLGAATVALALYLGLTLEPPLSAALGTGGWLASVLAGLLVAAALIRLGESFASAPTLLPHDDVRHLGLASCLWLYWRLERRHPAQPSTATALPGALSLPRHDDLPDIVAVQSESFCDARRLWGGIRPTLLPHFDRAVAGASRHGRLDVPAWGANTMRTEFGFLTGIAADQLGVDRFNPYRRFARRPIHSLASLLRTLGYRTVCIHPHPASFFSRDRVYPQLGFDEFVDLTQFDRTETCGPYICDAAVARMIGRVLDASTGPVFVFAITMENHGPLHLERVAPDDDERLYERPPPALFTDLTVYLRHLVNADAMLGHLIDALPERARPGVLCWFGDHVPSMPDVYAATGQTDGRTDYLIWRSGAPAAPPLDLPVEEIGAALLEVAGLARPFVRAPRA